MKKLTLSIFTLFFTLSAMASGGDNKNQKEAKAQSPLTISSLNKTQASPDFPGGLILEFGFNFLTDEPSDMELAIFGSKVFNIYYMYEIRLGNSAFSFNPGFGVGLEKYKFDKDVTLEMTDTGTELVPLTDLGDIKKSKLAANYIDIPLELRFHFNKENFKKSFKIGIGGKAGFLFDSHTKIRYEADGDTKILKSKEKFDLNRFRYGVQGRIGVGSFSVFYYQELSELFKDGRGPEETATSPFKVGIALYAF